MLRTTGARLKPDCSDNAPATLQKFASVHATLHNQFHLERHLYKRRDFKANRAAALAEWRQLGAA